MTNPSSRLDKLLDSEQRDRARDQGHFTMYGMRVDAREHKGPESENPGNGDNARRFASGGDLSTYANRSPEAEQAPGRDTGSDAPAHKPIP